VGTHAPAEVRKRQILEAALGCFGEKGLQGTTMDDIVEASGLSKGAIYSQFESKDQIFLGLFWTFELDLFAAWEQLPEGDAVETVRRIAEVTLTRLLELRPLLDAWTEFLRQPASRERMAEAYAVSRESLGGTLRRGIEEGSVRPTCDADAAAAALTALVEGLLLQAFADPDFDPLEVWPEAWETVARGVAA